MKLWFAPNTGFFVLSLEQTALTEPLGDMIPTVMVGWKATASRAWNKESAEKQLFSNHRWSGLVQKRKVGFGLILTSFDEHPEIFTSENMVRIMNYLFENFSIVSLFRDPE